jgi:hypothetical protein
MTTTASYGPTPEDIETAHKVFPEHEPRDLAYRAAAELVALAIRGDAGLSATEALAVLLLSWNRAFYRFAKFDAQHFVDIEEVVNRNWSALMRFRQRSIATLRKDDIAAVSSLFVEFEGVLGPVGAAKALHLLAPQFFPLWDREIATKYKVRLRPRGRIADLYVGFMLIAAEQCSSLCEAGYGGSCLKALDEYNFCKYTRKWI